MNPAKIQSSVAEAIRTRKPTSGKYYLICYLNHKIQCRPVHLRHRPEIVFGNYSDNTLNEGFTQEQWHRLAARIQKFLTQKGI